MFMFTPLNLSPWEAAGLGAVDAAAAEAAAEAVAAGATDAGAAEAGDDGLGEDDPHPASTSTKPIAGATVLNRDTGFLLLTLAPASSILNARRQVEKYANGSRQVNMLDGRHNAVQTAVSVAGVSEG